MNGFKVLAAGFVIGAFAATAADARSPPLDADTINAASFAPLPEPAAKTPVAAVARAAILLDRARFSPGSIDGIDGDNFHKALGAYQGAMGLPVTSRLDQATWDKLTTTDPAPVIVTRKLSPKVAKGPFATKIPAKFEAQAKLKRLAYTNGVEALSEEVHTTPGFLRLLNPKASWKRAGGDVAVPQVVVERGAVKVASVVVDKPGHAVDAYGADGKLVASYPASIGSDEKPAPSGAFTIRRVVHNPGYTYNPKYAFKGVKTTKPFTIAPGPNNPVGSVWMDLSFEGYGIHGTPQPDLVGKTQSHGCIRLTNWDAEDLASMVAPGTPVTFVDQPVAPGAPAPPPPASPPAIPAPGGPVPATVATPPAAKS